MRQFVAEQCLQAQDAQAAACGPGAAPAVAMRRRALSACVAALLAVGGLGVSNASAHGMNAAATFNVNRTDDPTVTGVAGCAGVANDCSLRQALVDANATAGANTINLPAGTYTLAIAPSGADDATTGDLDITGNTTISGAGASSTIVQWASVATAPDRVFDVEGSALATITGITIQFGNAPGSETGGGVLASARVTLRDDVITDNEAAGGGGGVDVEGTGIATITSSTISVDEAGGSARGGGVRLGSESTATIDGSTITGNRAQSGGGVVADGTGALTITNSTITSNSSPDGGGVAEEGGGPVQISGSTINGNGADSGFGGGVSEEGGGTIDISQSTIDNNTSGDGGGIAQEEGGAVTVTQSTIASNTADVLGGGIAVEGGNPSGSVPAVELTNDTITANRQAASFRTGGGGIALAGGTAVVVNSTIAGNTTAARTGGNLENDADAPVDLTNTIIAGGSPANCDGGSFFSSGTHGSGSALGHNLDSDGTCGLSAANGDLFPTNPMLGPLADNGGPTQTMALLSGSPAIGAANESACPALDQRGSSRAEDDSEACDIGAFEVDESNEKPTATTTAAANTTLPGPPINLTPPTISGNPLPGHPLGCSTGTWSGNPTNFAYRWNRAAKPIAGSITNRYTVQILDEAQTLTCTVTATGPGGAGAPATSAGVLVAVKGTLRCPAPSGRLTSGAVGPLSLGLTRPRARHRLHRFTVTPNDFDDFCLFAGWGIRVGYPSPTLLASLAPSRQARVKGRIVLALTANPFYNLNGVTPGMRLAAVAHRLHVGKTFHIGLNYWYFAPGATSNGVLKVRHGVIQEIGLANRQLTTGRAAQNLFMHSFTEHP